MAITSLDNLISSIANGKSLRMDWNKITGAAAYTAGRWYDMSALAGTPIANAWAGTALNWVTCTETTGNGTQIFGIQNGGNVSTDIKHMINAAAMTAKAFMTASAGGPEELSAEGLANAILDALLADHNQAGSVGEALNSIGASGNPWSSDLASNATPGTFGEKIQKLLEKNTYIGLK